MYTISMVCLNSEKNLCSWHHYSGTQFTYASMKNNATSITCKNAKCTQAWLSNLLWRHSRSATFNRHDYQPASDEYIEATTTHNNPNNIENFIFIAALYKDQVRIKTQKEHKKYCLTKISTGTCTPMGLNLRWLKTHLNRTARKASNGFSRGALRLRGKRVPHENIWNLPTCKYNCGLSDFCASCIKAIEGAAPFI